MSRVEYIQLDVSDELVTIVCKDNEGKQALIFHDLKEAIESLSDNCKNGIVIPLDVDIMQLLKDCSLIISDAKLKLGNDIDPKNVEQQVNKLISL